MNEQKLIKACMQDRSAYEALKDHIHKSDYTPLGAFWWSQVRSWYGRDNKSQSVDLEELKKIGERAMTDHNKKSLLEYFSSFPDEVSTANIVHDAITLKREQAFAKLLQAGTGKECTNKLIEVTEEYLYWLTASDFQKSTLMWTEDDDLQMEVIDMGKKISLAPAVLNNRIGGGACRGDHIIIFGRPGDGKTLFTLNMVAHILRNGYKVLYIGNEESTYKHRKRLICSLSGCPEDQLESNYQKAANLAKERGLNNLRLCHLRPGTIAEIDALCTDILPDVLVLDQIRNLQAKGDGMTAKLETLGIKVRSLIAKHNCLGISITQANDRSGNYGQEPPTWLTMADLDSSRTGLPAQADLMLGIGNNPQLRRDSMRAINICKTKYGTDQTGFYIQCDFRRHRVK